MSTEATKYRTDCETPIRLAFAMGGQSEKDTTEFLADYRAAVLKEYAERLANRATLYGDSATVGRVIWDLDHLAAGGA